MSEEIIPMDEIGLQLDESDALTELLEFNPGILPDDDICVVHSKLQENKLPIGESISKFFRLGSNYIRRNATEIEIIERIANMDSIKDYIFDQRILYTALVGNTGEKWTKQINRYLKEVKGIEPQVLTPKEQEIYKKKGTDGLEEFAELTKEITFIASYDKEHFFDHPELVYGEDISEEQMERIEENRILTLRTTAEGIVKYFKMNIDRVKEHMEEEDNILEELSTKFKEAEKELPGLVKELKESEAKTDLIFIGNKINKLYRELQAALEKDSFCVKIQCDACEKWVVRTKDEDDMCPLCGELGLGRDNNDEE